MDKDKLATLEADIEYIQEDVNILLAYKGDQAQEQQFRALALRHQNIIKAARAHLEQLRRGDDNASFLWKVRDRALEVLERIRIQADATGNHAPVAFNEVRDAINILYVETLTPKGANNGTD